MNPDPFSYFVHRSRRVEHDKARELAKGLRGEASYKKAQRILKNHDLTIERKEFYNLTRKEAMVGILNTGKTFPFALCFITSETTASFEFIEDQLDDLFLYNCPRPKVICGDFAKEINVGYC